MSEVNPLVERVDALLKRHQPQAPEVAPPATRRSDDDDIPVLTDVVEASAPSPSARTAAPERTTTLEGRVLAAHIEDAVLEKLILELDDALRMRLNRSIGNLLEQHMDGLRAELSATVRDRIREAVEAAVKEAIHEPPALESKHPSGT
jgi:hypothetical protein